MASSKTLGRVFQTKLQKLGIGAELVEEAKDLGVGTSAGKRRAVALQNKRIAKAVKRRQRIRRLVAKNPQAAKLNSTGAWPQAVWSHEAMGLAPSKVRALRTGAA